VSGISKEESENEPLHNEGRLWVISSWADTVSWVMLVGHLVIFFGRLIVLIQSYLHKDVRAITEGPTITSSATDLVILVNVLLVPVTGVTYFLILQAVSQGILMLMDLEEAGLNSEAAER
jgi:hypothetical protein